MKRPAAPLGVDLAATDPREPAPVRRVATPALMAAGLAVGSQVLLVTYLVWRYGLNVPILDQWSLVEDLAKLRAGEWTVWDLWRSHNGHRILVPRLILVPLGLVTGWNIRIELALELAVASGSFLLLAWGASRLLGGLATERCALALAGTGALVYSLAQWENWLWGFQIQVFLSVLFALASFAALTRPRLDAASLGIAVALAACASVSQAAGLVTWPVGLLVLATRRDAATRRRAAALWTAAAAVMVVAYFRAAPGDAHNLSDPWQAVAHPVRAIWFVLTVIGAPVVSFSGSAWPPETSTLAPIVGALGLIATVVVAWPRRGAPQGGWLAPSRTFLLAASLWGVGVAGLVALGRAGSGLPAAMASRYTTLLVPFWVALLVLATDRAWPPEGVGREGRSGLGAGAARLSITLLLAGVVVSSISSVGTFPARHRILEPAQAALADGGPQELLERLHPEVQQVFQGLDTVRRLRLSVFHASAAVAVAPTEALSDFRQELRLLAPAPATVAPGEVVRMPIEARNAGVETWPSSGETLHPVNLSYRWLDARTGELVVSDGRRTPLPGPLHAGASVVLAVTIEAPGRLGTYVLQVTAVQEGVDWFTTRGAEALDLEVEVVERTLAR